MLTPLRELAATVRDFARIVHRAVRFQKIDLVAVIAFGFLGAAAQIGAIAALLGFLRLMGQTKDGEPVTWHGFHLSQGLQGLMMASGVLALMLIVAAIANYLAVRRARAIGRACAEKAVIELLGLIDQADRLPAGIRSGDLRNMGVRGSRLTGISVENFIKLIHPIIQIVVLVGAMFVLDAWATTLFLPALLVPVPVIWKFNRSVRESARLFYESAAPGFGRAVGQAIDSMLSARLGGTLLKDATIENYNRQPAVSNFFHRYDDLHLTAGRSVLITSLFRPLMMVYVLLILGIRVGENALTWPDAMAFLLVLVQMTMRVEGVVAQVSVLSRLHTQIEPFIQLDAHVKSENAQSGTRAARTHPDSIQIQFEGATARCEPGHRLQIYTGRPVHRLDLFKVFDKLAPVVVSGMQAFYDSAYVGRKHQPLSQLGLYALTNEHHPGDDVIALIEQSASVLGVLEEIRRVYNRILTPEDWAVLSSGACVLLQLGPILCQPHRPLLIDLAVLTQLDRLQAQSLLEQLATRIVVILAPNYPSNSSFAESVVAMSKNQTVWVGTSKDWLGSSKRAQLISDAPVVTLDGDDETLDDNEL